MATLPRGLCIALTLWLAMSRPSAANRTESPDSAHRWGSEDAVRIQKSAEALRRSGDFVALEALYERAAAQAPDPHTRTGYLTALGNTRTLLFRYSEALEAYTEARGLAHANQDWLAEGAVSPGLSSLYLLTGDWPAARQAAEAGIEAARHLSEQPYYAAQLKLQHARLYPGAPGSAAEILEAIDAARQQLNLSLEAEAWDLLGEERQRTRDLPGAEAAFTEAHRLRFLLNPHDLRLSYWRLGALRLAQGRLAEAEHLNARAIAASPGLSSGELLHQRGLIRQAQGLAVPALADFEAASLAAARWRQAVPPPEHSTLAAADAEADLKVHRSYIEAAAQYALATGDPRWSARALLAVERNRAASLRQSSVLAEARRRKLPPRYWQTLARLRQHFSEKLYSELTEMEAVAGLGSSPNIAESFSTDVSLTLVQQGLSDSELFLSFYTGTDESYLWALTRSSLHLYRLPGEKGVEQMVHAFQNAISHRAPEAAALGEHLYDTLFGELDARESTRPAWLLSLTGPLFDLPFAALRTPSHYLAETHALQVVPAATMLRRAAAVPRSFLGVGDPVYNAADERISPSGWPPAPLNGPGQMNRLPASAREIARATAVWGGPAITLLGADATRARFVEAFSVPTPRIVHLATHIIVNPARPGEAQVALSLDEEGSPEYLGAAEISLLPARDSLVVMTGCSSGVGEARPAAGLLGLTRAWLTAGAASVLATGWPVEDTSGDLLPAFYRHLDSVPASEALRRAQIEMIRSGTWQAAPAYWAAFSLTGGAR